MEIEEVDSMILEPFDLHTSEHLNDHSPTEYLTSNFKFYLPTEPSVKSVDETHKEENDVDALWTKAVDNMFKSSRLFNNDMKEEEKENVDENLLENNISREVSFQLGGDDQELKAEDTVVGGSDWNNLIEEERFLPENKESKNVCITGDQIVPSGREATQASSLKRKRSDLDVNFSGLSSMNAKSEYKKMKIDPETGKEVIEDDGTVTGNAPPKNSVFVDYSFDPMARLPSFREAFVPALKRISRREKELKKVLKGSIANKDRVYTLMRNKTTCNGTPAEGQNKSESEDQLMRNDTGVALEQSTGHPEDTLSKFNEIKEMGTIDQGKIAMSPPCGATSQSKAAEIPHFEGDSSKNDLKIEIKQENTGFLDCNRNERNRTINDSPAKILGISSANLKDIEKNIFSFDEGLEILDLDRDFSLPNIVTSHADPLNSIQGNNETDWSINLSHGSDVHAIAGSHLIGQGENEVTSYVNNHTSVSQQAQYLNISGHIGITSLGHSFSNSPVTSYSMPLSHGDTVLSHFENNQHIHRESMKYTNANQHEMKYMNMNEYEKRLPDLQIDAAHQNHAQFPQINLVKQQMPCLQNNNTRIEGQMIARQIHQSFGADVFGVPGDDGAKILAKYLAQRGSARPDNQEQRGGMTSAIASLISKSFSQQEANQRLQRDNNGLDFLHATDFENLDLINEHF